ncbi:MAG: nickel pincer cofactor biosynthesis protein LarC [Desulfomonilaceae bacterium]
MTIAYFDCFAGASGDMILGALIDAGLDPIVLKRELATLPLDHYDITTTTVERRGIKGTKVTISTTQSHHCHPHRNIFDIQDIITRSGLAPQVKEQSIDVFSRLAEAEASVHGIPIDQVHFHEVGAIDAIIDVVGAVAAIKALDIQGIFCSPLHVGSGTVQCDHGALPVPAPATTELIKGKPVYSTGVEGELLTPTGAAILTTLAAGFGPLPAMKLQAVGYGAGTRDLPIPNLLRVLLGEPLESHSLTEADRVAVIETNIDDMNPQIYDYVIEGLFQRGALDVFLTPVHMKKNRPGALVTVICQPEHVHSMSEWLMRETTTIGTRWRLENRVKASRSIAKIHTRLGEVRIKIIRTGSQSPQVSPEYDDCRAIASRTGLPLKEVLEEVRKAGMSQLSDRGEG